MLSDHVWSERQVVSSFAHLVATTWCTRPQGRCIAATPVTFPPRCIDVVATTEEALEECQLAGGIRRSANAFVPRVADIYAIAFRQWGALMRQELLSKPGILRREASHDLERLLEAGGLLVNRHGFPLGLAIKDRDDGHAGREIRACTQRLRR
jgi:hypothetical protein